MTNLEPGATGQGRRHNGVRHSLGEERERSVGLRDVQGLASDKWDASRRAFYEGVVPTFE